MPRPAVALLVALFPLLPARAQAPEPDFARLEKVVADELKATNTPGAAVAVVRGDRVLFAKGFGLRSVEFDDPVTADTVFRLGSTTKMFTAAAVVQLAEEGKIDLHAPVGKYLKDLPAAVRDATPHQLLTHTAGLTDESPMFGRQDDAELGRGIRAWKDDFRFADPGKVYSYSNPGYWVAGLLVEETDGKPFADALRDRLFRPLGMARTSLRPTDAITHRFAVGHDAPAKGTPKVIRPLGDNAATRPAGQINTTALDLARWAVAVLNGGRLDGKEVLPPPLVEKLTSGYVETPGRKGTKYGYGLNVTVVRGVKILEHGGSRAGYGSEIRFAPEQKAAVIVLVNKTGGRLPKTLAAAGELMLTFAPPADEKKLAAEPITEEEGKKLTGRYTNNRGAVVVSRAADGKLVLKGLPLLGTFARVEGWRFAGGGREVVFVPRADGSAEFLSSGGRAMRRVGEP